MWQPWYPLCSDTIGFGFETPAALIPDSATLAFGILDSAILAFVTSFFPRRFWLLILDSACLTSVIPTVLIPDSAFPAFGTSDLTAFVI